MAAKKSNVPADLIYPPDHHWMTVKELKDELKNMPDDAKVLVTVDVTDRRPLSFVRDLDTFGENEVELYSCAQVPVRREYRYHIMWEGRKDPYIGHKHHVFHTDDEAIAAVPEIEKGYQDGDLKAVVVEIERIVRIPSLDRTNDENEVSMTVWTNHVVPKARAKD